MSNWNLGGEKTGFYKEVTLICQRIPEGRTATYGWTALLCSKPRNTGQVRYAPNRGLAEERAPARRVMSTEGALSDAAASESHDMQKLLLEREGVTVAMTPDGWRVKLKRFGWNHTPEDALRFRTESEKYGIWDRVIERSRITRRCS